MPATDGTVLHRRCPHPDRAELQHAAPPFVEDATDRWTGETGAQPTVEDAHPADSLDRARAPTR
ncbi:hypothetical protein HS99_0010185 [Kitasatospora aureofaciens]|uniref:Uncharacterized protein n=1 Tax=Kitasatospora aureofaciens TaxID=1894 RepID=A0A1E7N2B5_KITAU|nr:hypothetical protein B6264_25540 [Kitasatospora aureofaciens]OEV34829.1 hypothetical protein HS99_0010185 [Kitasatospora aureofaciens]GGU92803.1 hypothetical protein GCM10010502_52920 [Kitasatospora aureofaciens]